MTESRTDSLRRGRGSVVRGGRDPARRAPHGRGAPCLPRRKEEHAPQPERIRVAASAPPHVAAEPGGTEPTGGGGAALRRARGEARRGGVLCESVRGRAPPPPPHVRVEPDAPPGRRAWGTPRATARLRGSRRPGARAAARRGRDELGGGREGAERDRVRPAGAVRARADRVIDYRYPGGGTLEPALQIGTGPLT